MSLRGTARPRWSQFAFTLVFILGLASGGCSIHPLPDDVTGVPTYIIVRQVRCETRQAVIQSLFNYLTTESNIHDNLPDEYSYNIGRQVKREYELNHDSIIKFNPAILTGSARKIVGLLYHTGIAYNYDLTGLEINNIDPAVDFLRPLPKTTLVSLGLTANFDRQRQNERSFTITDNFGDLVTKVHDNYCSHHLVETNYVYPIAGRVGIDRMVHDFVLLTLFGNLGGTISGKDPTKVSGPPTMVDQLQFQTTIGGGATPKVVFIPLGPAFSFSDASFPLAASRKDTHLLTVGLYLDKTGASEIVGVRTGLFSGRLITASGGTAEQGAAMAVEQFLQLKIFKPTVVVGQ
jgi:hypothetical protein